MLLTFIAVARPSLTHLLFALCFIERDESVFPHYCPAQPTLLPWRYILQTAPRPRIDQMGGCDLTVAQTQLFYKDLDDER